MFLYKTIIIDDQEVELGANWIHGVLGNPMYELAMANGLVDITHRPKLPSIVATTVNGTKIPFQLLQVWNYVFSNLNKFIEIQVL